MTATMTATLCQPRACAAGERVDSINHYAKEIRSLEGRILALKEKILEVRPLFSSYTSSTSFWVVICKGQ